MRFALVAVCLLITGHPAIAEVSDAELLAKFRSTWRAQDGSSADVIVSEVGKVTRFISRGWKVIRHQGDDRIVELSWAQQKQDTTGEEYTLEWVTKNEGTSFDSLPAFKVVDLGWRALALSLIGDDITNEVRTNMKFGLDPRNYNFIETPRGNRRSAFVERMHIEAANRCRVQAGN